MPPKKRHRRSASVPGGTRSESRIHRYFVRHRQSSGLLQPVPIRVEVAGMIQPPAVSPSATSQPAFNFSHYSSSHVSNLFAGLPVSLFTGVRVPVPIQPLPDCKVKSIANPSASSLSRSPVVRNEVSADNTPSPRGQQVMRCHSQPGALLTRTSSLKRRHGEARPRLDFHKMRVTAYTLDSGSCARSQSSTFLSTNEEELLESPASCTDQQLAKRLNEFSLSSVTHFGEELPTSNPAIVNLAHCDQQGSLDAAAAAAAVLANLPVPCSSSSEDDEVAAINVGCEELLPCTYSQQPAFADHSPHSAADDLDLELIEQN